MEAVTKQSLGVRLPRKAVRRRERWAWYFFDFGNSAYAAVVLLAVYSAYFKQTVVGGAEGSRLWGVSIGIAMLIVSVLSPVLGAWADFTASKKRLLFIFSAISVVFTALLFFVEKGDIFTGMLFFILAEIGYRGGQVFYNALLPEIAEPEQMGRVSGNGWAFGSFGGIICLLIVLGMILLIGGSFVTRLAFVITAVFYALSAAPVFLFLKERNQPKPKKPGETAFSVSLRNLWNTYQNARHYREFLKFMIAFLVYNNGIMITLDFAAIIGATLFGLTQQQLIIFMMIVQVTSVIGAFFFGKLVERIGGRNSLAISIVLMIFAVSGLFFVQSLAVFYAIGAAAGFALTGVQSISRTLVGQLSPGEKATEFYGLFSLGSQLSAFLGPTLFGVVVVWFSHMYEGMGVELHPAEMAGTRLAVILIVTFLLVGLGLLFTVRSWKRIEAPAEAANE